MLIFFLLVYASASAQKSYSLAECITRAQQHNPDILLQNLNISRAENTLSQSLKSRLPMVSGSVSSGLNGGRSIDPFSNSFVQRTISYNSFSVSTNLLLFNGFSLRNQIEKNRANKEAEQVQLEVVRKEIRLAVIEAYENGVISREMIRLQRESLLDLEEQAESVKERIKEGLMASYSLMEAEAQIASARFELTIAENNYLLAKKGLAQLMMTEDDFELMVPQLLSPLILPENRVQHPALRVWDSRMRSARYSVDIARAEKYPRLSLNVGLGTSYSSGAVNEFNYFQQLGHNFNQFTGLGLSIPIFSNGLAASRIEAARIEENMIRIQKNKAEIQLNSQIETLKLELTTLKEKLNSAEINLKAQTRLYEATKEKFKEGLVSQMELNTYRLNREKAQVQSIQTRYELYFKNKILETFYE